MSVTLLLADPHDPAGEARAVPLQLLVLQTSPGGEDVTVSFRPNRADDLYASAKDSAHLAYRILFGEGIVRAQLAVRCQVPGAPANVVGRSADLAFALAILLNLYAEQVRTAESAPSFPNIAATGVLGSDGTVRAVEHLPAKLRAALKELGSGPAAVFFPIQNRPDAEVDELRAHHPDVQLLAIGHLDEALEHLGIPLERVYLRNPFRGLQQFEYEHRAIFFGRETEVREILGQLLWRESAGVPGILVEGPSGSGKSSFLRAGVIPALVNPRSQASEVQRAIEMKPASPGVRGAIWRAGLMPGVAESAIVRSIRDCWSALAEWATDWQNPGIDTLEQLAQARREHWPTSLRFVWVIDQFEELFALGMEDATLEALGAFLGQLQRDGAWTLASIRADAMPQLKTYKILREIFGPENQFYLPTLQGVALDDVIELPAKAAALRFGSGPNGKRVNQLLRDEAYREQDSLPLLQFTLNELYLRRVEQELTYAAYLQLGGLAGSIATTAEAIFKEVQIDSGNAVARVFRSLVSVDDSGRATRRYATIAEIARDPVQKKLVLRLVEARLCVTSQREGESVVAFAHDSLLRTLPALSVWLKEEGALLQTRVLAEREARLWLEHGQSNAWLAAADKALSFSALIKRELALPTDVRAFIERSERQARRTAYMKRTAVALMAILALTASAAAWIAINREREAQFQTAQAREAQLQLLTQSAAERLKDGDLTLARGIELEVLRRRVPEGIPDPAAMNVLQEIRASDPALAILTGHSGPVRQVSYSPDGRRIVTSSDDNTARIWDSRTGIQLAVLRGKGSICSAVYSSDGHVLISADDGTNGIWDVGWDAEMVTVQSRAGHCSRTFSIDGGRFITSDGKVLQVWEARTGRKLAELERPSGGIGAGDLSPDSAHFVAGTDDNTASVWDLRIGKQVLTLSGHLADVNSARYSPDGRRIVTTSQDNTARIWDAMTGAELSQVGHIGMVFDAAFSPDGKRIASVSADLTARIWDAATGKQLQLFSGHTSILWAVAFSPDGTQLATGAGDGTARTWSLRQTHDALVIGNSAYKIAGAAYSPDGSRLLTLSDNQPPRIWDAHSGAILAELSGQRDAHRVAVYSPDGRHVLASIENVLRIWDATTGSTVLDIPGPAPVTDTLAYSPDGKRIVAAFEDFSLQIRDAASGSLLVENRTGNGYFTSVEFSGDGRRILTGSLDNTARIYDAGSLRQLTIFPHKDGVRRATFSPDGSRIVTACHDGIAYIWDAGTGAKIQTLAGHHAYVWGAAFSPDGNRVVTGSRDQTVRIWDAHTGIELAVLTGHQGRIEQVGYSPDGNYILSTSSLDNTARVWDARVPADWRSQITWEQAVEPDALSDVQRTTLGIATTSHVLTGRALSMTDRSGHSTSAQPSSDACSQNAAAYYDPDRTAPGLEEASIQADVALSACSTSSRADTSGRIAYQRGRALLAKGDAGAARMEWESALARGYRAARVDLALLLTDPTRKMLEPVRATSLLEAAWHSGVVTAAYDLGTLYEHGVPAGNSGSALQPDSVRASFWYEQGAKHLEPHALAHAAQHAEFQALVGVPGEADAGFFGSFKLYSQAVQQAQALGWPDSVWKSWRYRRSTLARVLAMEGKMQEVADAYERFGERKP